MSDYTKDNPPPFEAIEPRQLWQWNDPGYEWDVRIEYRVDEHCWKGKIVAGKDVQIGKYENVLRLEVEDGEWTYLGRADSVTCLGVGKTRAEASEPEIPEGWERVASKEEATRANDGLSRCVAALWKQRGDSEWNFSELVNPNAANQDYIWLRRKQPTITGAHADACAAVSSEPWTPKVGERVMGNTGGGWHPFIVEDIHKPRDGYGQRIEVNDYILSERNPGGNYLYTFRKPTADELAKHWPELGDGQPLKKGLLPEPGETWNNQPTPLDGDCIDATIYALQQSRAAPTLDPSLLRKGDVVRDAHGELTVRSVDVPDRAVYWTSGGMWRFELITGHAYYINGQPIAEWMASKQAAQRRHDAKCDAYYRSQGLLDEVVAKTNLSAGVDLTAPAPQMCAECGERPIAHTGRPAEAFCSRCNDERITAHYDGGYSGMDDANRDYQRRAREDKRANDRKLADDHRRGRMRTGMMGSMFNAWSRK